jgi:glycerol-3-phosphate O-acyltransferase
MSRLAEITVADLVAIRKGGDAFAAWRTELRDVLRDVAEEFAHHGQLPTNEMLAEVNERLAASRLIAEQAMLTDELEAYTMTKSSLHFPVDRPLPKALVTKLIAVRLREIRAEDLARRGA